MIIIIIVQLGTPISIIVPNIRSICLLLLLLRLLLLQGLWGIIFSRIIIIIRWVYWLFIIPNHHTLTLKWTLLILIRLLWTLINLWSRGILIALILASLILILVLLALILNLLWRLLRSVLLVLVLLTLILILLLWLLRSIWLILILGLRYLTVYVCPYKLLILSSIIMFDTLEKVFCGYYT